MAGVFGLAGCAAWQAKQLELEYKRNGPLPSARGPLGGVARWSNLRRRGSNGVHASADQDAEPSGLAAAAHSAATAARHSAAEGHLSFPPSAKAAVAATAAKASAAASLAKERASLAKERAQETLAAAAARVALVRTATGAVARARVSSGTALSPDSAGGFVSRRSSSDGGAETEPAEAGYGVVRRHVLFVGDSLVTGVGCCQSESRGPALPRAVAEFLSRKLKADVGWAAIGSTGSDVRTLQVRR